MKKTKNPWQFYAFTSPLSFVFSYLIFKYEKIPLRNLYTKTDNPVFYYLVLILFFLLGLYTAYLCYKGYRTGKNV